MKHSKLIVFNRLLKILYHLTSELGFHPFSTINSIRSIPIYLYQSVIFYLKSKKSDLALPLSVTFPCLSDRYKNAASIDKHYFYQDLWAAKKVYLNNPERHVDIGSRIDGFIAHLLTFRNVEVLDIRKLNYEINGMTFCQVDLMNSESLPIEVYDSVSCLHALEHFGLGRYGDPIDPEGHIKGLQALIKILKPNGTLLLSVPIGQERVEFNAHRVFAVNTIVNLTINDLQLVSFSYIDDYGNLHENANPSQLESLIYGCGLFEFKKM